MKMKRFIKRGLTIAIVVGSFVCLAMQDRDTDADDMQKSSRYCVDRVVEDANGDKWVAVEVYNESTGEITMVDIKVEEGFVVVE